MAISTVNTVYAMAQMMVQWCNRWQVSQQTGIGFNLPQIILVEASGINWQWDYKSNQKVQKHLTRNTKVKQQPENGPVKQWLCLLWSLFVNSPLFFHAWRGKIPLFEKIV